MAKGVEDTALYRHLGVLAANEVGGNPAAPCVSPVDFHRASQARNQDWPETMLALTTHDTKRSEDVRARLSLLTEIAEHWSTTVRAWFELNRVHHGPLGPDGLTEYLIYQSLVGAHPLPLPRAREYVIKAMREAKRSTSWLQPDEGVERDVVVFLERLMGDERFMAQLETFVGPLIGPGRANSLALKLAQLTSPGVPDLYQGSELWDLSLVDPDNRRPVDYTHRIGALGVLPSTAELLPRVEDDDMGLTKLFVVRRALKLRAHLPTAFGPGADHRPLVANGSHADHLVAFIRGADAITLVPRLVMGLRDGWGDTSIVLPPGTWADVFAHPDGSGSDHAVHQGEVLVGDLLSVLPVALLARVDGPTPT